MVEVEVKKFVCLTKMENNGLTKKYKYMRRKHTSCSTEYFMRTEKNLSRGKKKKKANFEQLKMISTDFIWSYAAIQIGSRKKCERESSKKISGEVYVTCLF